MFVRVDCKQKARAGLLWKPERVAYNLCLYVELPSCAQEGSSTYRSRSRNLVYLISCAKCGMQYVGETEQALHLRMNGHRSDIRTKKVDKPVAAHFCQEDHSLEDLEVKGIEQIRNNGTQWGRERESYWIFTLRTLAPEGMNLDE